MTMTSRQEDVGKHAYHCCKSLADAAKPQKKKIKNQKSGVGK